MVLTPDDEGLWTEVPPTVSADGRGQTWYSLLAADGPSRHPTDHTPPERDDRLRTP